jgi:shikimate dehydrogenase
MKITGRTTVVGVFGYPVAHSLSPPMWNAAFEHDGLDWCYVPFAVAPDNVERALRALPALSIVGVNLTIPLKERALAVVDEVVPPADLVGAVNTVSCREGRLIGYNTDVEGFSASLREQGEDLSGATVVVLGAGGAARAAVVALAQMGAARIWVIARRLEQGAPTAELARRARPGVQGAAVAWQEEALHATLPKADAVINATPIGMHPRGGEPPPVAPELLCRGILVYDMVYNPAKTRLLASAQQHGCRVVGGRRMLLFQGAAAYTIWTGRPAPVEVMHRALAAALEGAA